MEKALKFKKEYLVLLIIFLISFLLFYPSLFNFFSHDDFFHLKISRANNVGEFLNFFNLIHAPEGFGFYRPLTTQVFYFISWKFFDLNPFPLHLISFSVFFGIIFMVYKLVNLLLVNKKVALTAAFLYATSSTHFGHLYFLGTFQELGMTLCFLISVYFFALFLMDNNMKHYLISIIGFLGGILSKETIVTIPGILVLSFLFLKLENRIKTKFTKLLICLIPYFLILSIYLYLHVFYYGLATGDSYIWDFSPRVFNTIAWYALWSLNTPEMLVDFVGPGLNINPNLMKYYWQQVVPILVVLVLFLISLCCSFILGFKNIKKLSLVLFFCISWFLVTLSPVVFLPWHKFTYELTLPLIGVVIILAFTILYNKYLMIVSLLLWIIISVLTINLTYKTHWIVSGASAAENVHNYITNNYLILAGKEVLFYDTNEDETLPWKPSEVLKQVLSNNNYEQVFYDNSVKIRYGESNESEVIKLPARKFLNY